MHPNKVKLNKPDRSLELTYPDGAHFVLSAEFLRVHSPSAEVQGHGPGQEILQHSKKQVAIDRLEASGNYALTLHFSDGHRTGIYSWVYLRDLCDNQETYWHTYLEKLQRAGASRDPDEQVVRFITP